MIFPQAQAINEMNRLGSERIPFVFFTDFEGEEAWVKPVHEIDPEEVELAIEGCMIVGEKCDKSSVNEQLSFQKKPLDFGAYKEAFDRVLHEINIGNSYLVNLTFQSQVVANLSLQEIFYASNARYKMRYKDRFVVFSPETFVRIKDGYIYSHPMKGTIDADLPDAEKTILSDPKETAEHVTIVDLIRNDLSQIAEEVEVTKFRYLTRINTHDKGLLQVSSEIRGRIPSDFHRRIGTMLFCLLPAGSVSGAPKRKTLEIIKKAESYTRGYYTGICGFFDGESLDSGVMIRFIEKVDGQLFYKSGGGITSFSNARSEYHEIIDKIYVPIH